MPKTTLAKMMTLGIIPYVYIYKTPSIDIGGSIMTAIVAAGCDQDC